MQMLNNIEIAKNDFQEEKVNYYDFRMIMPPNLKEAGWRLPSFLELKAMYNSHLEKKLDFKNDWYMSEDNEWGKNMCVNFNDGSCASRDFTESHWGCCYIRLVRNFQ